MPPRKAAPAQVKEETPKSAPEQPRDTEPGFIGNLPDETPNEHYTLSGVLAGKPVPEHTKPVG